MMKHLLATLLALAITTSLSGATLEIDRAAGAIAGKEAQFRHSFTAKGFKKAQVESGNVLFGSMPRMKWTYISPEQKLFVFDGSRSWFFVPSDRQVTVATLDEAKKRELPFLLIGDAAARARNFNVSEKKQGNLIVTTLQPKAKGALVRSAVISITPADHLVRRIEYTDRDGNRTIFEFSGYHPQSAPPEAFRFIPPAGVQVVQAQ